MVLGALPFISQMTVAGSQQPRSQGLSSLPPLSLTKDNGGREERPWERGWDLK